MRVFKGVVISFKANKEVKNRTMIATKGDITKANQYLLAIPAVLYLLLMTRCLHLDGWLLVIFGGTGAGMIYLFLISFFVPRSQKKRYLNKILPGFLRKT